MILISPISVAQALQHLLAAFAATHRNCRDGALSMVASIVIAALNDFTAKGATRGRSLLIAAR